MLMDSGLDREERLKLEAIRTELKDTPSQRRQLIPLLQRVQQRLSYLPPEALHLVTQHLKMSTTEVYGVATFYDQFRFTPPGRHPVRVCMGTACHVKGGDIIMEHFERRLDIKEGETTPDREFSIERVACVGCCALAPVALVGDSVHGHMMTGKVEGLLLRVQIEKERAQKSQER